MTALPSAPSSEVLLRATGIVRRFGARRALRGVDLDVARGETVTVFGPNGAGKSTLLSILGQGLRADEGTVSFNGRTGRHDAATRGRIGLLSHRALLYDELSAFENLVFFANLYGVPEARRRADDLLHDVGLGLRASDPVGGFSRGMRQRLSLARALIHDPDLLLLDEPFSGLDHRGAEVLCRRLEECRSARRSVVLVTHDLPQGLELADRWILINRGRIIDEGKAGAFASADAFRDHYLARLDADAR